MQVPSDYDRMQSLWGVLQDSPFLIVFDGAERLLYAYHALDAAYKGDDFSQEGGDAMISVPAMVRPSIPRGC